MDKLHLKPPSTTKMQRFSSMTSQASSSTRLNILKIGLTSAQQQTLQQVTQMAIQQTKIAQLQSHSQSTSLQSRGLWNLDTYKLVRRLEEQFTREQSVAIMRALNAALRDAVRDLRTQSMGAVDLENQKYQHKTSLADLKSETQLARTNNLNTLRTELAALQADFDRLSSNFSEDLLNLRNEVTVEQATRKAEVRDDTKKLDLQISGLSNKLSVELSNQRTALEQVKVNLTRSLLWSAVGAFAIIMGVDQLSKE